MLHRLSFVAACRRTLNKQTMSLKHEEIMCYRSGVRNLASIFDTTRL